MKSLTGLAASIAVALTIRFLLWPPLEVVDAIGIAVTTTGLWAIAHRLEALL